MKKSIKNIILLTIWGIALISTFISFLTMFLGKHPITSFAVYMGSLAFLVIFAYANKGGDLNV